MARAYSHRFFLRSGVGLTESVTVGPGKRAVIKWITIRGGGTPPTNVSLAVAGHYVFSSYSPGAFPSLNIETRISVYAGETLTLSSDGPSVGVSISGYLFDDTGALVREERGLLEPGLDPAPAPDWPPRDAA